MTDLKLKELVLLEGEEVLRYVEGDAYTDSPNPLDKLFAAFFKVFWIIFGIKLKTYIIATNLRIVQVDKKTKFWGFVPSDTAVITINKHSIQSVGYYFAVRWFVFKSTYFVLENMTTKINIMYKGSTDELSNIVSEFSKLTSK